MNYEKIIAILLKRPILFDDFLEMLSKCTQRSFEDAQLEFELLLINGLPLELEGDFVYLKTQKTAITNQEFCIVDIETNGSFPKKGDSIIELGAIKYKNGEIIDKINTLVYASNVPENIQEVVNISSEMLKDAPTEKKVLTNFKNFLKDSVFVAHNVKFDYNFISDCFEKYDLGKMKNRKICTIDLAKRTIKTERYGLKYLKRSLSIDVENMHRAYWDALATVYVLEECFKRLPKNIITAEDLMLFSKSDCIIKK